MSLGGLLREIRTSNNKSQEEFAEELGYSQSAISQMERGTRAMSPHFVMIITKRYKNGKKLKYAWLMQLDNDDERQIM